ncbi:MAG: NADH-quinone oxidoreductase subunit A [Thermoflexales bacterium]|nr:NADH-quinone oxidoreductase subunit A [Thermoflexales bacterium]
MMLSIYLPILILFIVATFVAAAAVGLGTLLGPRRPTPRKQSPYESGMTPIGPAQRRFPIKFYLVAVLFILFDVEIVFLYPWAVLLRDAGQAGWFLLGEMAVFMIILLVGYVYAWKKGALTWD